MIDTPTPPDAAARIVRHIIAVFKASDGYDILSMDVTPRMLESMRADIQPGKPTFLSVGRAEFYARQFWSRSGCESVWGFEYVPDEASLKAHWPSFTFHPLALCSYSRPR